MRFIILSFLFIGGVPSAFSTDLLEQLPDVLYLNCCSYVSPPDLIRNCYQVNKRFKTLAQTPVLWKAWEVLIKIGKQPQLFLVPTAAGFQHRAIEEEDKNFVEQFNEEHKEEAPQGAGRPLWYRFSGVNTLRRWARQTAYMPYKTLVNEVNEEESLLAIGEHLTGLVLKHVYHNFLDIPWGLDPVPLSNSANPIEWSSLYQLAGSKKLEYLCIEYGEINSDTCETLVEYVTEVHTLVLRVNDIASFDFLSELKKLKRLELAITAFKNGRKFLALQQCAQLTHLTVRAKINEESEDFFALISCLRKLVFLDFACCVANEPEPIQELLHYDFYTPFDAGQIAWGRFSQLQVLHVTACDCFDLGRFRALAPTLRELKCRGFEHLVTLQDLAHFVVLEKLVLSKCCAVQSLQGMKLPRLAVLALQGMNYTVAWTDELLDGQALPALRTLYYNITDSDRQRLLTARPSLVIKPEEFSFEAALPIDEPRFLSQAM